MNDSIKICEKNRFTKFVSDSNRESMRVLSGWMKWFAERGVKAVMAESLPNGWAIYRAGLGDTALARNNGAQNVTD